MTIGRRPKTQQVGEIRDERRCSPPAAAAISTDLCIVDGSPRMPTTRDVDCRDELDQLTVLAQSPHLPKLSAMSALMSIRLVIFVSSPIISGVFTADLGHTREAQTGSGRPPTSPSREPLVAPSPCVDPSPFRLGANADTSPRGFRLAHRLACLGGGEGALPVAGPSGRFP